MLRRIVTNFSKPYRSAFLATLVCLALSSILWQETNRQQVEFIHEAVIDMGGGAHGLRDAALLESALVRPKNQHAYGEKIRFSLPRAMPRAFRATTHL